MVRLIREIVEKIEYRITRRIFYVVHNYKFCNDSDLLFNDQIIGKL